jgi:NAD(P)-dependent dehydrogenase (short-subunit alcohol dehydrogenase family)
MPTILLTGASRGLGIEFVKHYAATGWRVHACARDADTPALKAVKGDVQRHALDVTDFAATAKLASSLKGEAIDVLLANAGISGSEAGELGKVDANIWLETFRVNALAPVKLAEAFVDNVAASQRKAMLAISSRLGSIGLNHEGGRYAYRASKAALNMAWKSLATDTKARGLTCVVLHPGWVSTDMGGAAAPVTPPVSVAGMTKVIEGLKPTDNGGFINYDGARFEW